MSSTITLRLNDFDTALLSEISKRDGRSKNELIVEALRDVFASRLDDKFIWLSPEVFNACLEIINTPEKDEDILARRKKLMEFKPVWEE